VPNLFHVRASTTDEIEAAVNHAWTIGINKIAVAYQDDAFGKEGLDALNAAMQKRGAAPVAVAPVPRGTVDVAKAVDVIAAAQPQAVLLIAQAKPAAAFIKAYKAKGASAQFMVLSVSSGLHAELGEPAAGVIVSQVVPYPFTELGNAAVKEYQAVISRRRQEVQLQQHGRFPQRQAGGARLAENAGAPHARQAHQHAGRLHQ
jgi:branched-chain amino acid transport system substrate-binding protein